MNLIKLAMAIILAVLFLAIAFTLMRKSRDLHSRIDLEDLLIGDDGKLSKAAAVMMGAFAMTTWLMIYLTLNGKMTEGYLSIYVGAWIVPTVVKLIKGPESQGVPPRE